MKKSTKRKLLLMILIGLIIITVLCLSFFRAISSSLSAEESIYRDTERLLDLAYENNSGPLPPDKLSWYGAVQGECWAYLQESVRNSYNLYYIDSRVADPTNFRFSNGRTHGVNRVFFSNGNSITLVYYQTWIVSCKFTKSN